MTQPDNPGNARTQEIRTQIQQLSAEYHELTRGQTTRHHRPDFKMPSGACFDAEDRTEAVLAALDLELSGGQAVVDFERALEDDRHALVDSMQFRVLGEPSSIRHPVRSIARRPH